MVFDKLYENKMNLGELYRIELGRNVKGLGYEVNVEKDRVRRITFEIAGVSEKTIKEFSQRRQDILKIAEELDVKNAEGLAYIAKTSREEKIKESREEIQSNWESRACMRKLDIIKEKAFLTRGLGKSSEKADNDSLRNDLEGNNKKEKLSLTLDFAIRHLSEREAVWDATKLHKTIWQKGGLDFCISEIEEKIAKDIEDKNILLPYDKNDNSYTTAKNLRAEKETIKLMQQGKDEVKAIMNEKDINGRFQKIKLSIGQQDAVRVILSTKDRIVGMQGMAGTGKTTILRKVKKWGRDRIELIGLAPTRAAVNVLKKTVDIEAGTLAGFTIKYNGVLKGRGTERGRNKMKAELANKLVVLDEASLASTKEVKKLATLAEQLQFRVVMMGDTRQ